MALVAVSEAGPHLLNRMWKLLFVTTVWLSPRELATSGGEVVDSRDANFAESSCVQNLQFLLHTNMGFFVLFLFLSKDPLFHWVFKSDVNSMKRKSF